MFIWEACALPYFDIYLMFLYKDYNMKVEECEKRFDLDSNGEVIYHHFILILVSHQLVFPNDKKSSTLK